MEPALLALMSVCCLSAIDHFAFDYGCVVLRTHRRPPALLTA
jgi:hypothetical protein